MAESPAPPQSRIVELFQSLEQVIQRLEVRLEVHDTKHIIDRERMSAEADLWNADWEQISARYTAFGRVQQAEKCLGRARYYNGAVTQQK